MDPEKINHRIDQLENEVHEACESDIVHAQYVHEFNKIKEGYTTLWEALRTDGNEVTIVLKREIKREYLGEGMITGTIGPHPRPHDTIAYLPESRGLMIQFDFVGIDATGQPLGKQKICEEVVGETAEFNEGDIVKAPDPSKIHLYEIAHGPGASEYLLREVLPELWLTYDWMLESACKPRLNSQELVSRAQSYRDRLLAAA